MPIFEYKCEDCNTIFEVLHKSISNPEIIICPKCNSQNYKKLLSSFSSAISSGHDVTPCCSNGSCGAHKRSNSCADRMCGLS